MDSCFCGRHQLISVILRGSVNRLGGGGINNSLNGSTLSFNTSIGGLALILDGLTELVTESSLLSNHEITAWLGSLLMGETIERALGGAETSITLLVLG